MNLWYSQDGSSFEFLKAILEEILNADDKVLLAIPDDSVASKVGVYMTCS